jgi:hypothetical protein
MKKINNIWIRIIIPFFLIVATNAINAQSRISEVKSYMRTNGDWISSDSKYANLVEDQNTNWWYRTFAHGYEYKIVAFCEDGEINDMELEVQYSNGTSFSYDIGQLATIYIRPISKSGSKMRVRMRNFLSDDPDYASKCHFIVFFREY